MEYACSLNQSQLNEDQILSHTGKDPGRAIPPTRMLEACLPS